MDDPADELGQTLIAQPAARVGDTPGEAFGDFTSLVEVGRGGAGVVYRACQGRLGRTVALKLILHAHAQPADVERFMREARMAARLSHPNIVPIYEVGEHDGKPYLVMKLIEGRSLDKIRVTLDRGTRLMVDVADAVAYAHRQGVVHRDLKPHNLMLGDDGQVYVTDFGLARQVQGGDTLTMTGTVLGTPTYMPPEQASGEPCDERSDVYSLGATLYDLATGRPPFEGPNPLAVMMDVLRKEPLAPRRVSSAVSAELEAIIGKAMEKDPGRRYATAHEFADDLRRHLQGETIRARSAGPMLRTLKWAKRNRALAWAGASIAAALVTVTVGAVVYAVKVTEALRTSDLARAETMVVQAKEFGVQGRWQEARGNYQQARTLFERWKRPDPTPMLGFLDAHHHAPSPWTWLTTGAAPVTSVAFSADGRRVVTAGADGMLQTWDAATGVRLSSVGVPAREVETALSRDGGKALVAGGEAILAVWDLVAGRRLWSAPPGTPRPEVVALSPDGRRALTASSREITLWDAETGTRVRSFAVDRPGVTILAFSPDGRLGFAGSGGGGWQWNLDDGAEVRRLVSNSENTSSLPRRLERRENTTGHAFSPDGKWLMTAGVSAVIRLWDLATERELREFQGHMGSIDTLAFSRDGKLVASGSGDRTVKLWHVATGRELRTIQGHAAPITSVAFSPDGRALVAAASDGNVGVWPVEATLGTFADRDMPISEIALAADGRLAAVTSPGRLVVLDVATNRMMQSFEAEGLGVADALAFSPDGRLLATGETGGGVRVWDVVEGRLLHVLEGQTALIRCLEFTQDHGGRRLMSAARDGTVRVWDLATQPQLVTQARAIANGTHMRRADFSRDGQLVAWAAERGEVVVSDLSGRTAGARFKAAPSSAVFAIAFLPDGGHVLAATGATFTLWDWRRAAAVRTFTGHTRQIQDLASAPSGALVLSGAWDGTLRLWETSTGRELYAFRWAERVDKMAMSADGNVVLTSHNTGRQMRLWDFRYPGRHEEAADRLARARAALQGDARSAGALQAFGDWYGLRGVADWSSEFLRRARELGAPVPATTLGYAYWAAGLVPDAQRELKMAQDRSGVADPYLSLVLRTLASQAAPASPP